MKFLAALLLLISFSTAAISDTDITPKIEAPVNVVNYDYGAYKIVESPNTKSVFYSGDIVKNSDNVLISHMKKIGATKLIILSDGGDAIEGLNLGAYLHKNDIHVEVPYIGNCSSACAFAVMGVKNLDIQGYIAFHHPYTTGVPTTATIMDISHYGAIMALTMIQYANDIGINQDAILDIYKNTDTSNFIVFHSKKELDKYLKDVSIYKKIIMSDVELYLFKRERLINVYRGTN